MFNTFYSNYTLYTNVQTVETFQQSLTNTNLPFDPISSFYWRTNTSFLPSGRWFLMTIWVSSFLQNYTSNHIPPLYVEKFIYTNPAFDV